MAEHQVLGDAMGVSGIHSSRSAEAAAALGGLVVHQMAAARTGTEDLASGGDFKPLGDRFLRLNTFWSAHKFRSFSKRARTIGAVKPFAQAVFLPISGRGGQP
jgi:hypothetical protein